MDLLGVILGFLLGRATSGMGVPSIPPILPIPPIPPILPKGGKVKPIENVPWPIDQAKFPVPIQPQPAPPYIPPYVPPYVQPGRLTYTIASGDTAVQVAKRFNGTQVKRPTGGWIWKELNQAIPALDTSGQAPSPWTVGATIVLPPLWTIDAGVLPNATGAVGSAVSGEDDFAVVGDDPFQTV